jgi:hypothetical protein
LSSSHSDLILTVASTSYIYFNLKRPSARPISLEQD